MEKPVAKLRQQLSPIAIGFFLLCFQASADTNHINADESIKNLEHSVVELIVTPTTLTPGQQLNLLLKVSYAEQVEIVFNARQVDWQAFTLLNSHDASPQWFDNHWQKQYNISLSVPVAGEYQLPLLTIHSYLAEHHKQLTTSVHTIKVVKSVTLLKNVDPSSSTLKQTEKDKKNNALTLPPLQDIERIDLANNDEQNTAQFIFNIAGLIIAMLVFFRFIAYWYMRLKRKKHLLQQQSTPTTQQTLLPTQLLNTFQKNGYCDWQQLQQWLEKQMLQQSHLPAQAAIKQQYKQIITRLQHLRFGSENQHHFANFCQQCQQLHDDTEQNMLKNVRSSVTIITSSVSSN